MNETRSSSGPLPGRSPAEILALELKQASVEHALWTLTAELRRIYGPQAERVSVMASKQADTGRLTADTLRVLDEDFEALLPDFKLLKRACEQDMELQDNLALLTDLTDPEHYAETDEDLGDHLLGSPLFLNLKRALDAWLTFAETPEHPSWPHRQELTVDDRRPIVLPSSIEMRDMTVPEFITLKRRLLAYEEKRTW